MRNESAQSSELFLTFLHWARAASERALEENSLGVTLGMRVPPRHGSCCSYKTSIEAEHEASIHEL